MNELPAKKKRMKKPAEKPRSMKSMKDNPAKTTHVRTYFIESPQMNGLMPICTHLSMSCERCIHKFRNVPNFRLFYIDGLEDNLIKSSI